MKPTNARMEFCEIEKKTVPGIKAFQMNSTMLFTHTHTLTHSKTKTKKKSSKKKKSKKNLPHTKILHSQQQQ